MNPTIPPPFEPQFTLLLLPLIAALGIALVLFVALWGKQFSEPFSASGRMRYQPNRFLAVLVALLTLKLVLNILVTSGYIYYVPLLALVYVLPLNFLIGPLLYLYIRTMTSPEPVVYSHWHLLHLAPLLLGVVMNLPMLALNADTVLLVLYDDIYPLRSTADFHIDGLFSSHAVWTMNGSGVTQTLVIPGYYGVLFIHYLANTIGGLAEALSLCAYAGCSFYVLRAHKRTLRQLTSAISGLELQWMVGLLLLSMLAIGLYALEMLAEVTTAGFNHVGHPLQYAPYYVFAVLICFIAIKALRQPQIFSPQLRAAWQQIHQGPPLAGTPEPEPESASQALPDPQPAGKYRNSVLTPELSAEIVAELAGHMATQQPWLDADLTLAELASQTGLSTRIVSQVLNETLGQNFFDYINGFRIQAVKARLNDPAGTASILSIALDCGFNSKSAFYNEFKKREGMSPTQWRTLARRGPATDCATTAG